MVFKNCHFNGLPTFCKDLSGMDLAPSMWIGQEVKVGPEHIPVIQPGDLVEIAGVDHNGGIYLHLGNGSYLGAVEPENITPWRMQNP